MDDQIRMGDLGEDGTHFNEGGCKKCAGEIVGFLSRCEFDRYVREGGSMKVGIEGEPVEPILISGVEEVVGGGAGCCVEL